MSDGKALRPQGHRFYFLGAALFVLAALYPILGMGHLGLTIWTVTLWIVLLATIHAASLADRPSQGAQALHGGPARRALKGTGAAVDASP